MARDIIIEDLKLYYTEELFKEQTGYTYTDISDIDLNKFFQKHCDLHKQVINVNELSEKYNDSYVLVNTPDGFQDINDLYIKGPYSIYTIKTADFSIKCSSNHLIETIEGWKHAENLIKGDTILTKNGYQDVTYIYKGKSEITYDFEVVHENHRYWGGNGISSHNTGKSYLSCSVVREAQKKGYDAVYIDSEGAIDAKFVSRLGVDPNKLIIKQVSTIFETSNFLSNILKALEDEHTKTGNRRKVIFVLDSLGNLTSDKEKEDMLSGNQKRDMTKQQEIKAMFRVIATPLARAGAPLIVVNHVYACCTSDTEVLMSNGTYKFINDINIGDYVLTCNGSEKVVNTFEYPAPYELYELTFSDGYTIKCTEGHKFLCNVNGELIYKSVIELSEDDEIIQI